MLPTLVNHTTQNTSHTQPQLTSQLQYTTNQPHTTLKTDVVISLIDSGLKTLCQRIRCCALVRVKQSGIENPFQYFAIYLILK